MGKKKYAAKIKNRRENRNFDLNEDIAFDVVSSKPGIRNAPATIYANASKKGKRKARKTFLKHAAVSKTLEMTDAAMDDVVIPTKAMSKGWHKVTLANAGKFAKNIILEALVGACTVPFSPVGFVKTGGDYAFHVECPNAASALKALDKKVSLTHNFLLKIKVVSSPAPKHVLNDEIRQQIKEVMATRFDSVTKALNLKSFHNDARFLGEAAYVPLARSNVMNNVIRVVGENIPDVAAIDFSENKLPSLDHFSMLEDNAPHLQMLDLSNNRLNDIRELEKLKGLQLKVLNLAGNSAMERKYADKAEFVRKVQQVLPKLEILDGQELPKTIVFEDTDDASITLPPTAKLMSVDESVKSVMLTFLQQYFSVYDQDDRSALIAAYHPHAMFSMSAANSPGTSAHGSNKLIHYLSDARNLNMVLQSSKRSSFLKQGHEHVVKFLNDLPKSAHDLDSFSLDIPFANTALIVLTLTGVFRERACDPPPLRQFNRNFVIVPQGTGFVITNDSLFITNAIGPQAKQAFIAGNNPSIMPLISPKDSIVMVQNFAKATNLRPDWAKKCLEETRWNMEGALSVFQAAKIEGKIPPEAFAFMG